ncbi:hypothetical protein Cni_G16376 [Canna indica]|uniref:Uncharacterized protein n=1 Tax=Canna indica TaxID=4628 RepID=A0AAQ3KKW5_9LILI|nr:hypothetical protein Cni_G16376 [Canna indica]
MELVHVPKGWDRLLLPVISVQSEKVIARIGKATIRSGNSQFTETKSICVSQECILPI